MADKHLDRHDKPTTVPHILELSDDADGTYRITTETSTYVIDLDHRRLLRVPGTGEGPAPERPSFSPIFLSLLDNDNRWVGLHELIRCSIGSLLYAHCDPIVDHKFTLRRSTIIRSIEAIPTPPDDGSTLRTGTRPTATPEPSEPGESDPVLEDDLFFDRTGAPIDIRTAGRLRSDPGYRQLARTEIPGTEGLSVVTVWLGTDQGFGESKPLIFGTAVLGPDLGDQTLEEQFAATEVEAYRNHQQIVQRLLDPPNGTDQDPEAPASSP